MNRKETAELVRAIRATYITTYKNISEADLMDHIKAWHVALADFDYMDVQKAYQSYLTHDKTGFPPQVNVLIQYVIKDKEEMLPDVSDAWNHVMVAAKDALYDAKKQFNSLSLITQKVLGSPEQLRNIALSQPQQLMWIKDSFVRKYQSMSKNLAMQLALESSTQNKPQLKSRKEETQQLITDLKHQLSF